jgi:hypothetical protein
MVVGFKHHNPNHSSTITVYSNISWFSSGGRRGRHRMVVGFKHHNPNPSRWESRNIGTEPDCTRTLFSYYFHNIDCSTIWFYFLCIDPSLIWRVFNYMDAAVVVIVCISAISWPSGLLVEEIRAPGENHRPVVSHWQTLSHYVASSTHRHERDSNSQLLWW